MEFKFIEKFESYFDNDRIKYAKVNDILWNEYNRAIVPIGPVKFDYRITRNQINQLLSTFPKALFIRANNGFQEMDSSESPLWYAVIKNTFVERENLTSSSSRKRIKKGLEFCKVEKIDADYIARKGYNVFYEAVKSYKGKVTISIDEKGFSQKLKIRNLYPDIFHYWGIFNNSKLIGYAENLIYDSIEASYSTIKLLPEKLDLLSSYALVYSMDEYYLKYHNFGYVNDGFRNIIHDTNIQGFLIKNFNFFKQPTELYLYYKPIMNLIIRTIYPFRNLIVNDKPKFRKVKAMFILEEIRRNYLTKKTL